MIGDQTHRDPATEYTQTKAGEGLPDSEDRTQLDIMRGYSRSASEQIDDTRRAQKHRDYLSEKNPRRTKRGGAPNPGVTPPRNGGRMTHRLAKIVYPIDATDFGGLPKPGDPLPPGFIWKHLGNEKRLISPAPSIASTTAKQGGFLPLLGLLAPIVAPIISRILGSGKKRPPSAAKLKRHMKIFTNNLKSAPLASGSGKFDAEYWEQMRTVVRDALYEVISTIFEQNETMDDEELARLTDENLERVIPHGFVKHAARFYDDDGSDSDKKRGRGDFTDALREIKKHEFLKPYLNWEAHKILKKQFQGPERAEAAEKVRREIMRLPANHALFKTARGEGLLDWVSKGIQWVGQKVLPNLIPAVAKTVEGDSAARAEAAARAQEVEERRQRAEERRREEDLDRAARRRRQQEDDEFYAARRARDLPPPTRERLPRYEEADEEESAPAPKPTKKAPGKKKPAAVEASGRFKKK